MSFTSVFVVLIVLLVAMIVMWGDDLARFSVIGNEKYRTMLEKALKSKNARKLPLKIIEDRASIKDELAKFGMELQDSDIWFNVPEGFVSDEESATATVKYDTHMALHSAATQALHNSKMFADYLKQDTLEPMYEGYVFHHPGNKQYYYRMSPAKKTSQ